ncbi:MAG TPA: hypothetical protein VFO67_08115 [Gemmatimonadales bacterium]|nr:hypothetical protein [Gemmatimonadales bacterium]
MSELGRYRRLYTRLWAHSAFVTMAEGLRLVCLYLLTGPQQNRLGFARLSVAAAAEDLRVSVKVFRARLETVCAAFGWHFDPDARVLLIPSWWKFNEPTNSKHLLGCLSDLADVPDTALLAEFLGSAERLPATLRPLFEARIRERIGDGIRYGIGDPIGDGIGYQEQEQELRQEQEPERSTAPAAPHAQEEHTPPMTKKFEGLSREPADDGNFHVILKLAHTVMDETGLSEPTDPNLIDTLKCRCATEDIDYGRDPAVLRNVVHRALNAAYVQRKLAAAAEQKTLR